MRIHIIILMYVCIYIYICVYNVGTTWKRAIWLSEAVCALLWPMTFGVAGGPDRGAGWSGRNRCHVQLGGAK